MPEFSLEGLVAGRVGVRVEEFELRRIGPLLTEEQSMKAFGSPNPHGQDGSTAIMFGLPSAHTSETVLVARANRIGDKLEWKVTWGRGGTVYTNDFVRQRSDKVGGMLGLEALLSELWTCHTSDIATNILVTYELIGWRTSLLTSRKRPIGQMVAANTGAFWSIEGSQHLVGVSFTMFRDSISSMAIGRFDVTGWPNTLELELALWTELQPLLSHRRRSP